MTFPLRLQGRYVHDDAAIADEDARFEAEVTCFRNGETIRIVLAGEIPDGGDPMIAARSAAEAAQQLGKATEDRAVAIQHSGGTANRPRFVQSSAHGFLINLSPNLDLSRDFSLATPPRPVIQGPHPAHRHRLAESLRRLREASEIGDSMCLAR